MYIFGVFVGLFLFKGFCLVYLSKMTSLQGIVSTGPFPRAEKSSSAFYITLISKAISRPSKGPIPRARRQASKVSWLPGMLITLSCDSIV